MKEQVSFFYIREFDCYNIKPDQQANISYELEIIARFLKEDCTKWKTPQFIQWLTQPHESEDYTAGTEYYLIYLNGNMIISKTILFSTEDLVGPLEEDTIEEINAPKFYTTVDRLLPLLVEWNTIINTKPRFSNVTLTMEEGYLSLSTESQTEYSY